MGLFSVFKLKGDNQKKASDEDFSVGEAVSSPNTPSKRTPRSSKTTDPLLPEKKRARRRLIGAIALALGAAIGLPLIFDSEPRPLPDDLQIQIPGKDQPVRFASTSENTPPAVSSAAQPVASVVAQANAGTPVARPAAEANKTAESTQPPAAALPKPVESKGTEIKPVPVKVENKPEPKTENKPENKSAISPGKASLELQEAERARAILEGKAAHPAAPQAMHLQVAALASQDKLQELQSKLQAAGISSYTQKVSTPSGEVIRVRIGPLNGQDEVAQMRARLQKIGLSASLVPR